jgi:hypothetical protein
MHAKVYRNAAWTIPTVYTTVPFDTIPRDPMGLWVPGAGFVVQTAGIHLFSGVVTSAGGPGSFIAVQWVKGGVAFASASAHGSMGFGVAPALTTAILCAPGDVVVFQATATPTGAAQLGANACFANIDYLGTG